jgi:hypothetical protein
MHRLLGRGSGRFTYNKPSVTKINCNKHILENNGNITDMSLKIFFPLTTKRKYK